MPWGGGAMGRGCHGEGVPWGGGAMGRGYHGEGVPWGGGAIIHVGIGKGG